MGSGRPLWVRWCCRVHGQKRVRCLRVWPGASCRAHTACIPGTGESARRAVRPQDGLQICCGGFGQRVDARLADGVEEAAVFAEVTDRPAPPRLVGRVLHDLAGSGPWSGISVPSTPGTTAMVQVGGQDRQGPCWAKVSWSSARSSPAGMTCRTRILPSTYRTASHTPIGYSRSPGRPAALPEAGLAVVRAAEQHGKAAIAVGASAPSTPVFMAARYRPVRHPGSAGVRHLSFSEPPDTRRMMPGISE
jgi:hypothetical protein